MVHVWMLEHGVEVLVASAYGLGFFRLHFLGERCDSFTLLTTFNGQNSTHDNHNSHSATTAALTTTPQPWLPLQMLLELPEEQFYSHGRPACSSRLRQTLFSH